MDSAKQQLIDKLKTANNILVTVRRDPSVDQLASCIALTLLLNKQGKHAAAVFSGEVPSTIEFLQPEATLEKNTDSLRDFIIALDKSKADKLRYKVEDNIVRIFITPYKTSISQADLEFSEGDFNVDVVVALGVLKQEELDEAIVAHGRILHDATVASINTAPDGGLGAINWYDPQASSLSELVTDLAQTLGKDLLDNQIATALLTGIVSETGRFSNDKTSSQTMSASAALMAAGANQQLVASKLQEGSTPQNLGQSDASGGNTQAKADDGMIQIKHKDEDQPDNTPLADTSPPKGDTGEKSDNGSPSQSGGGLLSGPAQASQGTGAASNLSPGPRLITEPPTMGGTLTANTSQEGLDPSTDTLGLPTAEAPQMLDRKASPFGEPSPPPDLSAALSPNPVLPAPAAQPFAPAPSFTPPPQSWAPPPSSSPVSPPSNPAGQASPSPVNDESLTDLEKSLDSPHIQAENVDEARDEVDKALTGAASTAMPPEPIQALNAQQIGGDLHPAATSSPATPATGPQVTDPTAPPPVPPPIPFQFGNPPNPQT